MLMLSVESLGRLPLIRVSGHLVQGQASEAFMAAVRALLSQGHVDIACQVSAVDVIDSTGMGVLVAANDIVRRVGGRLILCEPSKRLRGVLTTTHLIGLFEIVDDQSAAVEWLERPKS
jgi:anti-sigma B factor antagonist